MLTELDVINAQLATIGQAPLSSITQPNRMVLAGLQRLREESRKLHATFRWWNTAHAVTITPDPVTKLITGQLPDNVLALRAPQPLTLYLRKDATGAPYLYDVTTGLPYEDEIEVDCAVEIPFRDLPPLPQAYLLAAAVYRFEKNFAGNSREVKPDDMIVAYAQMNAEDINLQRANVRALPGTAEKLVRARGWRPQIR